MAIRDWLTYAEFEQLRDRVEGVTRLDGESKSGLDSWHDPRFNRASGRRQYRDAWFQADTFHV